jgi:hypothetical protein
MSTCAVLLFVGLTVSPILVSGGRTRSNTLLALTLRVQYQVVRTQRCACRFLFSTTYVRYVPFEYEYRYVLYDQEYEYSGA